MNELIKTMEKMNEADERMRIMMDTTPLCAHFWDEDLKIVDCNQAAVKMFNLSNKQEYIERYFELTPDYQPDGIRSEEKLRQLIKETHEKGRQRVEWMRQALDGEPIPVELTLVQVEFKGKSLIVGYNRDLREQKQHEMELMRSREQNELQLAKLNLAVKATKIVMWEIEIKKDDTILLNDARSLIWSNEFRHLLGFTDENDFPNLVGSLINRYHPEDKKRSINAFKRHLLDKTGKTPYDVEFRLMKKNGEYGYYHASGETIRDENGSPVRVVGTVMDITETKNALIDKEIQLIKLNLMVQATKIGLWDMEVVKDDPIDPENHFTWSDEFRYMLGYTDKNDFPNTLNSWNECIHPNDKEEVIDTFEKHLLDKTGKTPYDIEYRMFKKNGECAYYRECGETIRDSNGKPIRVAGALQDVTNVKKLIQETERQLMEAESANKAKSDFLSTMSHEIRTPMNAILGVTEIQLQNETLDKNVKEAFEKIYTSGDMLLGIINDILDLSRIEAGKLELINNKYETASLISDISQLNVLRIGSKQIEFILHVDENLPVFLLGDEIRVKQILNNLLSNAFKYTAYGNVRLLLTTETIGDDDNEVMLIVSVSDTGQGMTSEQVSKLFDKFARFNEGANRTTEGTGLGMNITQNLVHLMKGEIFVNSKPGKGSTFTVQLPQGKVDSRVLGKEMTENLHKFRTSSRSHMKRVQITREPMPYGSVLVVDDVDTNIYVAKGLLAPYKLRIDSVNSGFAAIERIKRGKAYDIIFMDHMMPQMDGIKATKIIRNMRYDRPIVALTANAVAGQSDMFLRNGFDGFISKPIDVRELNSILNKFIRDKQPQEVIDAAWQQQQEDKDEKEQSSGDTQPAIDPQLAEIFTRDTAKSLAALDAIVKNGGPYEEDEIRTYVINTHGMKSALANIGKMDLSANALKLEQLGRDKNVEAMASETPAFLSSLRALLEELNPKKEDAEAVVEDKPYLCEKLLAIKAACEEYDSNAAEVELAKLRDKKWSQPVREMLSTISENLLHSDFDENVDIVNIFMKLE